MSTSVLLVEDDDGDALLVNAMLEDAAPAIEVLRARSLAEALDGRMRRNLSCVLLDLALPDAHGLQALQRLRDHDDGVPIVVLTGLDDEQRGIDSLGAGAQDYLVKDQVDGPLLARVIRYASERAQAQTAAAELLEARLLAQENTRLERGLLPTPLIVDPGVSLAASYRPGRRRALLGGDFYDAVETPDGRITAIIGDVCGHGPDEAAVGACLRVAWRTLMLVGTPVPDVLCVMDRVLTHERHDPEIFATAAVVEVAPDRASARLHLAGHPPPLRLHDAAGATAVGSTGPGGPPLGLGLASGWEGTDIALDDASALLLFTDGLIEGRIDGGSQRLGEEGLLEVVRNLRAQGADGQDLLARLADCATELNGGDLADDLAMVLLSWS